MKRRREAYKKRNKDWGYFPAPDEIKGIDDLRVVKPMVGGDNKRKRWKHKKGCIYEWDRMHGRCEKYDKNGKHQGEYDPETGKQTKPADKTRRIVTK